MKKVTEKRSAGKPAAKAAPAPKIAPAPFARGSAHKIEQPVKRIGILTGGGDCPGLNPAIRGVVARAIDHGIECVGLRLGWKGLLTMDTEPLDFPRVEEIVGIGGTILGTSRTNPFKKEGEVETAIANMRTLGLDAVVAIGGEDTLGVANRFSQLGVPMVGVPKTMDNDVGGTDYCFGFDTSVTVAMEAVERLRDTARSHRRVMVLEVMGRHAGWVALFTAIGAGADWVLIPEQPVNLEEIAAYLKSERARGKRYHIIVVSEGVELPAHHHREKQLDDFGHMLLKNRGIGDEIAKEIEKMTGFETRHAVIGHIQRGGSPTLFDRMLGTRLGVFAADLVAARNFGKMAALHGNDIVAVPLKDALSNLKTVPTEWYDLAKVFFK